MPEMTGIELLGRSMDAAPDAKRVLLTAYADTDVAIRAINEIGLDHYLMKPWAPPEERLYPVLDDLLDDWQRVHGNRFQGVRVVGSKWSERSHDTRMFLARNHVPYQWLELGRDPEAQRLQSLFAATRAEGAAGAHARRRRAARRATLRAIADALGLRTTTESMLYDLVVVGAGPAGLAAAVYGASEGLRTAIIEREAPGGQAAQSSRIENYLGFPNGLSGADLSHRAVTQAKRLGAEMVLARNVVGLETRGCVHARAVRRRHRGRGPRRAGGLGRVVPAARSAGAGRAHRPRRVLRRVGERCAGHRRRRRLHRGRRQLGRAGRAAPREVRERVVMLVRGDSLEAAMSQYLVERINAAENVDVRLHTEIQSGTGADHLETLTLLDRRPASTETVDANWLYAFIGALPRTDWLGDDVARDAKGFVLTGPDVAALTGRRSALAAATGAVPAGDQQAGRVRRGRRATCRR